MLRFLLGFLLVSLLLPHKTQAIVFLPAIILIPIVKIVAIVIGALAIPTTTLGVVWSKLFRHSLKQTLLIIAALLGLIALALVVVLKLLHPDRPVF